MADTEEGKGEAAGRPDKGSAPRERFPTRRMPNFDDDGDLVEQVVAPPPPPPSSRRVYALPQDLVDRIIEFQKEKGYLSEVEAARRLLDDALKYRDTADKIISRFMTRMRSMRITSEVAKDILVGHPLIKTMSFAQDSVSFAMADGSWDVTISDNGAVSVSRQSRQTFEGPFYVWVPTSKEQLYGPGSIARYTTEDGEDDIPF